MNTGLKFLLLFAAMVGLTATTILTNSNRAHAQSGLSVQINPSDISAAYFNRGYFKKAANGMWEEYDGRGTLRYTFREARRDTNSVYLREDALNVDLQIDAVNQVIYGEWPGQPRHQLYRITNMEIDEPTVGPPPTPPAPPTPPGPSIDSMRFVSISYNGGAFSRSGSDWVETTSSGRSFTFKELGNDGQSIYLLDSSRDAFLQIDTAAQKIRLSTGGKLNDLYDITDMAAVSANPPQIPAPPSLPGRMTPEERRECAASGGTIERAGILGAERCTMRFADGGMICTDSSQCQGKCLAGTSDANKSNITGTCQMTDNPFGCYAEVKNGKSDFALCVD